MSRSKRSGPKTKKGTQEWWRRRQEMKAELNQIDNGGKHYGSKPKNSSRQQVAFNARRGGRGK